MIIPELLKWVIRKKGLRLNDPRILKFLKSGELQNVALDDLLRGTRQLTRPQLESFTRGTSKTAVKNIGFHGTKSEVPFLLDPRTTKLGMSTDFGWLGAKGSTVTNRLSIAEGYAQASRGFGSQKILVNKLDIKNPYRGLYMKTEPTDAFKIWEDAGMMNLTIKEFDMAARSRGLTSIYQRFKDAGITIKSPETTKVHEVMNPSLSRALTREGASQIRRSPKVNQPVMNEFGEIPREIRWPFPIHKWDIERHGGLGKAIHEMAPATRYGSSVVPTTRRGSAGLGTNWKFDAVSHFPIVAYKDVELVKKIGTDPTKWKYRLKSQSQGQPHHGGQHDEILLHEEGYFWNKTLLSEEKKWDIRSDLAKRADFGGWRTQNRDAIKKLEGTITPMTRTAGVSPSKQDQALAELVEDWYALTTRKMRLKGHDAIVTADPQVSGRAGLEYLVLDPKAIKTVGYYQP